MKTIDIEVVDVRKISGDGKIKAVADVKFGDMIIARGFHVVEGKSGLFVVMPRKATKDGRWFDILVCATEEGKRAIEERVLDAYEAESEDVGVE